MLRGIYSVASAMEAASRNQEAAAENLTHSVTPGYRRQGTFFDVPMAQSGDFLSATQEMDNSRSSIGYTNFETGPIQQTNNPLDLALDGNVGNAFFVLDGPNGPVYTRSGGFERGPSGAMQLRGAGYTVRGAGGPIQIPADAPRIDVSTDGIVLANRVEVGRLQLATFDRPELMRRVGATLFDADNPQTPPPGTVRVEQGYREGSNVQPVQEMVSMMLGMRHYEAAERAIRALSEAVSQNTRMQQ